MGKKAAKKEKEQGTEKTTTLEGSHKPLFLAPERDNWVNLEFRLLNWKYMNFEKKYKDDTHIFTIKRELSSRHGRMSDLKLCINNFSEANEITDDMLTLKDVGVKGIPVDPDVPLEDQDRLPVVQIFYDFKPCDSGDPVLLYFAS